MNDSSSKVSSDKTGPNGRVIDVMNFLASQPTRSFSLTEISRHLGMSNGTAHRLLTALTESRFLSRDPRRKTYSLGMALVAIGQAAMAKHSHLDVARREIKRLARELNAQGLVSSVTDNELLILACEGAPQGREPPHKAGERRPLLAPIGIGHFAWADAQAQADYLAKAPSALSTEALQRISLALSAIRERGYCIAGSGPAIRALGQLTSLPLGNQMNEAVWAGLRQLLGDLSPDEIQLLDLDHVGPDGISSMTAPVFSPEGEVVLELSLNGLPPGLDKGQIASILERLRAAAAVVSRESPVLSGPEAKRRPRRKA